MSAPNQASEKRAAVCPVPPCRYGGAGAPPICERFCGQQTGPIWSSISSRLSWPDRNAEYEQRIAAELRPVTA